MIHFQFFHKTRRALDMMKYSAYHWNKFRFPSLAFIFGLLYFISSIIGELVNIFNLTNIGDITSLVQNYVALG
jgi:hypothetical protein